MLPVSEKLAALVGRSGGRAGQNISENLQYHGNWIESLTRTGCCKSSLLLYTQFLLPIACRKPQKNLRARSSVNA
jgi:hypothetical protein